jgi:hypothetical protein
MTECSNVLDFLVFQASEWNNQFRNCFNQRQSFAICIMKEEIENKKTLKANKDKEFILKCIFMPRSFTPY